MNRLAGSASGRWATAVFGVFALTAGGAYFGHVDVRGTLIVAVLGLGVLCVVSAVVAARTALLVALLVIVGVLGALRGFAAVPHASQGEVAGHLGRGPVVIVGTVRDSSGVGTVVDVSTLTESDAQTSASGAVLVTGPNLPSVLDGDRVEVDAAGGLRAPGARPGPESQAVLEREGVQAVAVSPLMSILARGGPSPTRLIATFRRALTSSVTNALPEPASALLLGVAFGIRQPLDSAVRGSLQDSGLMHVVAVSGLKVVIVLSLIGVVARAREWSRRRTLVVALPIVAAYVLLSGSGPAAVRSALMAGTAMFAGVGGRRTDPLPMLGLVAAIMVGIDPHVAGDVGFQLSFLGTLGIVVLATPLAARIPGPRLLVEPLATTIAAQLATVPVMAGTFGVLALGGPVANALVLPLLPLLIVLGGGAAILGVVAPPLAWLPLHIAAVGTGGIIAVAQVIAAIPGSTIRIAAWPSAWTLAEILGIATGALAWWAVRRTLMGHSSHAAVAAVVLVAGTGVTAVTTVAASGTDGLLHVAVLDAGSSTAVVVRTVDGGTALVDGGSSPTLLVDALGRVLPPATSRIDMVVITGGDRAAVAGLAGLHGHYSVGTVIDPVDVTTGAAGILMTLQADGADLVRGGSAWSWGGEQWSCDSFSATVGGRDMCALRVGDAGGSVLVLGDAGADDQEQLAAVYGTTLRADLIVSEPGGALSPLLLRASAPRLLAVPLAKGATPAPGLAELPVARTGMDGDLRYSGADTGLVRDP